LTGTGRIYSNMLTKYFKSDLVKNVFTLASGTAAAQVIPFLFIPVLSRLYTAADYAVFGLFFSLFEVLAVVFIGRYELTIVLPKKDSQAINIVSGGFIIALLNFLLLFLLIFNYGTEIAEFFNNKDLEYCLFLLPISLLFYSINRLLNNWLIRKKEFKNVSYNKVIHKGTESISALSFGFFSKGYGLIFGDILGRLFFGLGLLRSSIKSGFKLDGVNGKNIKTGLKTYGKFPLYNAIPALANSFANMLPILLISRYFDETITGNYNFGKFILAVPLALISMSLSQVLSQDLSESYKKEESVKEKLWGIGKRLFLISIFFVGFFYFFGVQLFTFVFGHQWELAGELTTILVFSYGVQFIFTSLYPIFYVFNGMLISSIWQVVYFLLIACLYFFKDSSIDDFVSVYVILNIIAYAIFGLLMFLVISKYEKSIKY